VLDLADGLVAQTTYLAQALRTMPADHPWSERAAARRDEFIGSLRNLVSVSTKADPAVGPDADTLAEALESMRAAYVAAYVELHSQFRLNALGDQRRQDLRKDPLFAALETLSALDLLDASEWERLRRYLAEPIVCTEFDAGLLEDSTLCPHCHLQPVEAVGAVPAQELLNRFEAGLDSLFARWQRVLRANLVSESAQRSLEVATEAERAPVERFLRQDASDPTLPDGFLEAADRALRELQTISISAEGMATAVREEGLPCSASEMERRLVGVVSQAMLGRDPRTTRLALDP
jgi:hypothetical protein